MTADAVSILRVAATSSRPASTVFGEAYTLVEAVEWFYEDSGHEDYRRLMLELAREPDRVAWVYGIEALYGDSDEARPRALGLTLHLDPESRRLAAVPAEERERARQWLDKNDPFVDRTNAPSVGTESPVWSGGLI